MNLTLLFTRTFFVILSVFFLSLYMVSLPDGSALSNALIGAIIGLGFGGLLIGFDLLFRRFNLRSFNIAMIGLFIGYLMGTALNLILKTVLDISATVSLAPQVIEMIRISLFLFGIYLGTLMTIRASDELYISIPFVRFSPTARKKKDLIIDSSVLSDARIIDLAASGLIDNQMVLPKFVIKDVYLHAESLDEGEKHQAKRALEVLKKLEALPEVNLRFSDTDFPDVKDPINKMTRLARLLDANLLTADISRVQTLSIEGIRIINIHSLSNSLKPLMQAGEKIRIKIQRYGKEPRQGVGYLEDGTMVVVNGGGQFIGEMIEAHVLSVKHTSSGRMIFCNAKDEEGEMAHFPTDYE